MSGELGVVDWSEALSQVFMYRGRLVHFIRGGRHKVKGLPPGRVQGDWVRHEALMDLFAGRGRGR